MRCLSTLVVATGYVAFGALEASASPTVSQMSECYQKSGTLEKVSCYDKLAVASGAKPNTQTSSTGTGKWMVTEETNPLDDSKTYVAILSEDEKRTGFMNKTVSLILRCKSDTTEVYISWGDYLGDDGTSVYSDYKNVIERLDSEQARTRKWSVSTNNTSTFAPENADIDLVMALDKADRYVVQTTPYGENPKTASFTLDGINGVAAKIAQTCNWAEVLTASRG